MKNNKDKQSKKSLADKLIKDKTEKFDNRFKLAPKGILLMALAEYYMPKDKNGLKNLEEFQSELLKQLSRLATDGESDDVFGKDFNEFFKLVINAFNKCAMFENMMNNNLEENEVEDEVEDDEDDEDDGIDED